MDMRIPKFRTVFVSFLSLVCVLPAGRAGESGQGQPDSAGLEIPYVLAIRGGVSLGAYESGLNWALLQVMKGQARSRDLHGENQPYIELRAAAGASAGSINALLSSISWCLDETRGTHSAGGAESVADNLLRRTWLEIGFDELLPKQTHSLEHYRGDDGVLTRNAFNSTIAEIQRVLVSGWFRPHCRVPLAILVTRVKPVEKIIAGVPVHNQRFVIPLTLRASGEGAMRILACTADLNDADLGNIMYLQGVATGEQDCPMAYTVADLVDAIEASSAFPIAFGRKRLDYCLLAEDAQAPAPATATVCPDGFVGLQDDFIDGGVFDNIPLGAAKALAEPGRGSESDLRQWQAAGRRFNYIYLDPTIRRSPGHGPGQPADEREADAQAPDARTFGLRSQFFSFFGGAIHSGRDYELYGLLRKGDWTNQVFSLAAQLGAAIRERHAQGQTQAATPGPLDCEELFRGSLIAGDAANPLTLAAAEACLRERVGSLEAQYRGLGHGSALMSAAEVTDLRNQCLDWIARLATALREPDIAWAAEQTRYDKLGDRRLLMSSRFSPVVGEMMEAFGGFVDRDFRDYDYYAGVYDAAWGIASFLCDGDPDDRHCVAQRMHQVYRELDIAAHPRANTVFHYLLRREFAGEPGWEQRFPWAAESEPGEADRNMLAVANSLFAAHAASDWRYYRAPDMTTFVANLIEQDFDTGGSSPFLQRIFELREEDEFTWYYPLTLRASNRLLYLERREDEAMGGGDLYVAGLALGAFFLHSYMQEEEVTFNVSTAPDFAWQSWLPDEIAVDARSGGIDLSWYQGLKLGASGWRWDVKLTPVQLNHSNASRDDNVWFSQADLLVSYKKHGIFSAVGFGPSASWTWKSWPGSEQFNLGAVVYMGLVEDKVRVTFGKMSLANDFEGDNYYLNIGINDIPGLVYWGFSDWRGSWLPSKVQW